jgi:tRNA dimethylallyltransferase
MASADANNLIVIVGPTGAGKSNLAIQIAELFGGEIVNADSRQVYRMMDIGTAKPSNEDFSKVPHHLFNIVNPDQDFNLASFLQLSNETIAAIQGRHKIPVLAGGSGQYIWSLLEGWQIPKVAPDRALRNSLEEVATKEGGDQLYHQLEKFDPKAAEKIDRRNVRRVIRALEVFLEGKNHAAQIRRKMPPDFRPLIIGLSTERKTLYRRTDDRVEEMFENGLAEEVRNLDSLGYGAALSSMNSIGYKQVLTMLRGKSSLSETKAKIKTETHRFIRHQYAWFKLRDTRIKWFDNSSNIFPEIMNLAGSFLDQVQID